MSRPKNMPVLSDGDEIRIIAPASVVEKHYIRNTAESLEGLGFKVSLGEHVFSVVNQFAGDDEDRLNDFQLALDSDQIKAVFCARGGYGSVRIFDKLDYSCFRKQPKWIVGFSDITIFHTLLNQHFKLPSIHAPMPVNYSSKYFYRNLLEINRILRGEDPLIEAEHHALNMEGKTRAVLTGGNLSILYSLQGTPWEIRTKDQILFVEEVGEQLYHLDRMFQNLQLAGKLAVIKGLIVGGLTAMKDRKRPFGKNAEEIVRAYAESLDIPVSFGFPAGHMENNVPFILGKEVELSVGPDKTILRYL